MLRSIGRILGLAALVAVTLAPMARAIDEEAREDAYLDRVKIDPYLDVEVWTNHSDNEFHEGDNVVLSFRASRDAFVTIYSIDSRGRVNLLFPTEPNAENYVQGGVTYRLPDGDDDFDLVISGPEGVENIQAIASRERFPIPDWYSASGLVCDWDDRLEYMDYVNGQYFVRYDGQRFAFDRAAMYINEWEPDYYRPIYYPHYPTWTVCGNAYIDYPWGASVYINGIYWGVTPLYIPRIYVGWHTFTVYDYYGSCWEYPVHVTRYNTVVLDRSIVVTSPTVVSKYKEVRTAGYRDPVTSGYPTYKTKSIVTASKPSLKTTTVTKTATTKTISKRYVRGSGKVVQTDRGLETVAVKAKTATKAGPTRSYQSTSSKNGSSARTKASGTSSSRYKQTTRSSSSDKSNSGSRVSSQGKSSSGSNKGSQSESSSGSKVSSGNKSGSSSGYYQKKSGSSTYKKASTSTKSSSGKSGSVKKSDSSTKAKSSGSGKSSAGGRSSSGAKSSESKPASKGGQSSSQTKSDGRSGK